MLVFKVYGDRSPADKEDREAKPHSNEFSRCKLIMLSNKIQ